MIRWLLVVMAGLGVSACGPQLPEPDSPAARLYTARCSSCHRLYAPGTMKYDMWKMQVDRMQGEMVRRGLPPLSASELALLLEYLKQHSG